MSMSFRIYPGLTSLANIYPFGLVSCGFVPRARPQSGSPAHASAPVAIHTLQASVFEPESSCTAVQLHERCAPTPEPMVGPAAIGVRYSPNPRSRQLHKAVL